MMRIYEEEILANRCRVLDDRNAYYELKRRYLAGNDMAACYYASFLDCGFFDEKDPRKAAEIIDNCAKRGFPRAFYLKSIWDEDDKDYWIRRGLEVNEPSCICSVAHEYSMSGQKRKAAELLIEAYNIGSLYAAGQLVPYFYEKGDYEAAAECSELQLRCLVRDALAQAHVLGYDFKKIQRFKDLYQKYKYYYPKKYWLD